MVRLDHVFESVAMDVVQEIAFFGVSLELECENSVYSQALRCVLLLLRQVKLEEKGEIGEESEIDLCFNNHSLFCCEAWR